MHVVATLGVSGAGIGLSRVWKELQSRVLRSGKERFSSGEANIVVGREAYGRPDADKRSLDFMRKGVYPAYTYREKDRPTKSLAPDSEHSS